MSWKLPQNQANSPGEAELWTSEDGAWSADEAEVVKAS